MSGQVLTRWLIHFRSVAQASGLKGQQAHQAHHKMATFGLAAHSSMSDQTEHQSSLQAQGH